MNAVKDILAFLFGAWSFKESFFLIWTSVSTLLVIRSWSDSDWLIPIAGVLIALLISLAYTTGRTHQLKKDAEHVQASLHVAAETRKMLLEAYVFEMWAFDLRPDPEHKQIFIQSRVSIN